ncbi:hypothetical protein NQZ68_002764 [Dissostichus eleginoides]|nr:hypothetical protein NQZ68_002764 [Dissostichus eleginoides]
MTQVDPNTREIGIATYCADPLKSNYSSVKGSVCVSKDYNDEIRQEQLRELSLLNGSEESSRGRSAPVRSARPAGTISTGVVQLQADGGVILYKDSALLHRVIEISTLRPTGMFDKLRETQSDTLEPSDHYKIYLSASGGYAYLGPQRHREECSSTSGDSSSDARQTTHDCSHEGGTSSESQGGSRERRIQTPAVSSHT